MAKKPVGNMDVSDLMELMKTTMNGLLEEKLANLPTKQDIEEVKDGVLAAKAEIAQLKAENQMLKDEISTLRVKMQEGEDSLRWLEHQISNSRLIFKGISNIKPPLNAVMQICTERLNISPTITSARTIFERNGTQTVIADFGNESNAMEVLRNTRNLAGTSISIDRDLNPRRQKNKVAMLMVRKEILNESKKFKIIVREDRMKINTKWFTWDSRSNLMCGREKAESVLKSLYGEDIRTTCFNNIFEKINSKN